MQTERDPRLDAAKGVLIALVVLGHLFEAVNYWRDAAIRLPLTAIYLFHMPAFVFMAGVTAGTRRVARRVATMLVLLVGFQAVYYLVLSQVESGKRFSWTEPFWVLWFLLAMAWWQALAPWIVRAPRRAFALAVIAALLAGSLPPVIGGELALSRTLVFLPFFVAGKIWGTRLVERAGHASAAQRWASLIACLVAIALAFSVGIGHTWLYASHSFETLGVGVVQGMATRAALLSAAALCIWTLLAFLPAQPSPRLSVTGRRSLAIYLLHAPLLLAITPALSGLVVQQGGIAAWLLCVIAAAGVLALLSVPGPDRWLRTGAATVVEAGAALPDTVRSERTDEASSSER